MKKKRPLAFRSSGANMASVKRNSERRAKSCILVAIFLAVFACLLVTEVFYVEEERWKEEKFLSMFNFGEGSVDLVEGEKNPLLDPISARVVKELSRFKEDEPATNSSEVQKLEMRRRKRHHFALNGVDLWQKVAQTRDKFFVYSAYYDDRRSRWVRVIAAARTRLADKVLCQFTYSDGTESFGVTGINRLIRENWNLKYSAYFILCPIKQSKVPVPHYVSIVKQGGTEIGNKVVVRDNKSVLRKPEGIAVCVKPLHYEYNKVKNLIEFIELNRILGVSHFVLYNHTVGTEVDCILRKYVVEGIVSVLPWQLDMVSQKEIRTEGLFAAVNDCLYRTMYHFRFVLMIDLDEYIIPHRDTSLVFLLGHLIKKSPDRAGAFSFQNAFFYMQWPNDTQSESLPYKLLTLQKTIRKSKLHAHKQRSKCILLPERVVEMGNHFVWEFLSGKTMVNVPPDTGFLHHYRVCEFGGNDCINTTHAVDRRTYKWREPLVEAVALRLRLLQPVCQNVLPFLKE